MSNQQSALRGSPIDAGTVYIVGIDGLSLDVIRMLNERGGLPNLARAAREGCHGPLATIFPTESSLVWTSIATGRHYRDHGIDGFQRFRLFGRWYGNIAVRRWRKYGLKAPLRLLTRIGLMKPALYTSRDVRAKRFWEIIGQTGRKVCVVNWWNSWPSEPVNGVMASSRLHYWRSVAKGEPLPSSRLTWPEPLVSEVDPLVMAPTAVPVEAFARFVDLPPQELRRFVDAEFSHHDPRGELKFLISADETHSRVFDHCVNRLSGLGVAAVYFRAPDIAQHCAFDYMQSSARSKAGEQERKKFGNIVPEAYRFSDALLGRVMARLRPDDHLFVLSDHGYAWSDKRKAYCHSRGNPPGVLYCMGPAFRKGVPIAGASVYDFLPTLLRLQGLPAAMDFEGRALEQLFTEEFLKIPAPPPIPTYGPAEHSKKPPEAGPPDVDSAITDRLKALGDGD